MNVTGVVTNDLAKSLVTFRTFTSCYSAFKSFALNVIVQSISSCLLLLFKMPCLPADELEPIGGRFTYQSLASELIYGLHIIKGQTGHVPSTIYSYQNKSEIVQLHSNMIDSLALILIRCPGEHATAGMIKAGDFQTHFDILWVRNSTLSQPAEHDEHLLQNILAQMTEGSPRLEVILLSVVEHC